MRVFVTGASGWIGSAAVDELMAAGHAVTGLARSDASAAALAAKGVAVRRGDLDDLDSLRAGATDADAVLHLANKHDWSNPAASNAAERAAVQTIGDVLAGTDRPFLLASGVAGLSRRSPRDRGRPVAVPRPRVAPRGRGEPRPRVRRPWRPHGQPAVRADRPRHGGPRLHRGHRPIARAKGVSGYPGEGRNRWAAVHRSDAARLVVLGLDRAPAGSRLHAVAEEGIPTREIAEAIGRRCELPVGPVDPADVSGPLRLDRRVLRHGPDGDQCADPRAAGLDAHRTHVDRGPGGGRIRAGGSGLGPPPAPRLS